MSDHVDSIAITPGKTRCAFAGILATVLIGLAPCAGAASAISSLAARSSAGYQFRLRYQHVVPAGISGQSLGQEVLSSAEDDNSGVCVDPHNASVLRITLDAAVPSMVNAGASVGPSVVGLMQTENHTVMMGTLDNALADVKAMGIVAANLSR